MVRAPELAPCPPVTMPTVPAPAPVEVHWVTCRSFRMAFSGVTSYLYQRVRIAHNGYTEKTPVSLVLVIVGVCWVVWMLCVPSSTHSVL